MWSNTYAVLIRFVSLTHSQERGREGEMEKTTMTLTHSQVRERERERDRNRKDGNYMDFMGSSSCS